MPSELVYAIDFGTSNSLLAAADRLGPKSAIPLDPGAADPTVLKSIFYTPEQGTWFFGSDAIEQYGEQAAEGRLFRSLKKFLPESSFTGTAIHGKFLSIHDLIAVFLREMRRRGNEYFQRDVTNVMLGRPALFGDAQGEEPLAEQRLYKAALAAGFKNIAFCPEPVAAAYEFRHQLTELRTVLIADFGGGTSDFTVLRMGPELFTDKDVLATHGISMAGDRFDGAMMRHLIAPHFGSEVTYRMPHTNGDMRIPQRLLNFLSSPADIGFLSRAETMTFLKNAQQWATSPVDAKRMDRLFALVEEHLGYKLYKSIEATKIDLSSHEQALFSFNHPQLDVEQQIIASEFEEVSQVLVDRITAALDETLAKAGLRADEIEIVCCTGGTAKLPALNRELVKRFGAEKLRLHRHFHSVIGGLAERAFSEMI
ncbi:MAG: Hsp70 family protein [Proteobacteria bacterium]|nr:Hsp70 family protein [Pseudomonadota bacterium]